MELTGLNGEISNRKILFAINNNSSSEKFGNRFNEAKLKGGKKRQNFMRVT
jgi:hypothetical protein